MSHLIVTMSGIINLLPDSLANQIAAGEVIQRPASVVKELMENALDAQSTQVKLIVKDSGKTLIQVVDNGIGMNETDARLAFERHATSKIKTSDDLFNIQSFGFRGEALASIAAVAHVDLKTRRQGEELGTHIVIEGSKVKKQEPCHVAAGTSFSVRNLFFNVPARRKFLKSDPVELKHILDEFTRIALPNPDVFFSVHHNDNELYHFPTSNLRQRLANYFGKNTNEKIVPVGEETDFVKISGYVGKPDLIKKRRGDQYLFVNKRYIKNNYLNHAIKGAYENLIPQDHHPFYVLLIEIDPAMIDVNIHPTKQEIKFENERLIYNYVKVAVKHALGKYSITPSIDFDSANTGAMRAPAGAVADSLYVPSGVQIAGGGGTSSYQAQGPSRTARDQWSQLYQDLNNVPLPTVDRSKAITLSSDWDKDADDDVSLGHPKNCFQVHDTYIVGPIKSGLLVIDQQAAHERIIYERQLALQMVKKVASQQSLFPESVELEAKYAHILETLLPDLNDPGFRIVQADDKSFRINAVPAEGLTESPGLFIENFVKTYSANLELDLGIHENIARSIAINSCIKKGKSLDETEMRELIDQLFACEMPYTSPSGKKCFTTFGIDELEGRFAIK